MAAGPIRRPTRGSRLPLWAKSARPDPSVGHSGSVVGPVVSGTGTPASRPCLRQEATRHAPCGQGPYRFVCYLMGEHRRLGRLSACLLRRVCIVSPVSCLGTRHGVLLLLGLTTAHLRQRRARGREILYLVYLAASPPKTARSGTTSKIALGTRKGAGSELVQIHKCTVATRVILPSAAS